MNIASSLKQFLKNIHVQITNRINIGYNKFNGLKYVKLDTSEKAESEDAKKDETPAQGGETKGKMNVYFCGCYGDEWKQPVGEPVHEKCPFCGMGTKETGCGNLLKTE